MLVQFQDEEYQFDIEALDLSEARYIKRNAGLSVKQLMDAVGEIDPEALAAIYWLMLKQSGKVQDISKLNFPVLKFAEALAAAFASENEGKEEDPTEAAPAASPAQQ